ncbi:MAG: TetR/AcrR family transcriptional regulator [Halanaerobiales bacterium]|nr:TetR/AcrR family transcriptional regulator [Halanaerobiales bacterium]
MPTDTFFNLSKEKKNRVLKAAINQFANNGYSKASVTQIVHDANIAKGSFYQYFIDKKKLYKYIVNFAINKKEEYINDIDNGKSNDIYDFLIQINIVMIKFAEDNIKLAKIINDLPNMENTDIYQELELNHKNFGLNLFIPRLKRAVHNKEIRSDINIHYTAHLLYNSSIFITNYFLEEKECNSLENAIPVIENIIDLIISGIKKNGGEN